MKIFSKRITSLILALILTFSIFLWTNIQKVSAAEPIKIGYSVSKDVVGKGDTVEVKLFFKNFEDLDIECTAFEYDLYIDPTVFSVESAKIHFDGTGAMMNTSKYNDSQKLLKNVYFNPGKYLPKNSVDISTFTLKLLKDFTEATDIELTVKTKIALDKDNKYFDLEYDTPVIVCGPSSSASPTDTSYETPSTPTATQELPTATQNIPTSTQEISSASPTISNGAEETFAPILTPNVQTYTVSYYDHNGRFLWSEKVSKGSDVSNFKTPSRPGYIFEGWEIDKGNLKYVDCDITATAAYTKEDVNYTITVKNGIFLGSDNKKNTANFRYDDCVIVQVDEKLAAENTYFIGWTKTDDNEIVSYNKTYSFLARGSCTVRAVFDSTPRIPVAKVVMYEHSFYLNSGVFSCERYIPSGHTYSGSGIILTNSDTVGNDAQKFVLNTVDTFTYRAQDSAVNAQFSVVHNDLSKKVYARAYLICKNEDGTQNVVYSNIVNYDPGFAS